MTDATPEAGAPAALMLDFLAWLSAGPRSYAETMDAWRTACPRLTLWEDALDAGWVARERRGDAALVVLTAAGRRRLDRALESPRPHG